MQQQNSNRDAALAGSTVLMNIRFMSNAFCIARNVHRIPEVYYLMKNKQIRSIRILSIRTASRESGAFFPLSSFLKPYPFQIMFREPASVLTPMQRTPKLFYPSPIEIHQIICYNNADETERIKWNNKKRFSRIRGSSRCWHF